MMIMMKNTKRARVEEEEGQKEEQQEKEEEEEEVEESDKYAPCMQCTQLTCLHHLRQSGERDELLEDVQFASHEQLAGLRNLKGHAIVLTGAFKEGAPLRWGKPSGVQKKEAKRLCKLQGGDWKEKISGKTTMLVIGKRGSNCGGTKTQDAKKAKAQGSAIMFLTARQFALYLEDNRSNSASEEAAASVHPVKKPRPAGQYTGRTETLSETK
jgi:NAD-dependent DNA ligase